MKASLILILGRHPLNVLMTNMLYEFETVYNEISHLKHLDTAIYDHTHSILRMKYIYMHFKRRNAVSSVHFNDFLSYIN